LSETNEITQAVHAFELNGVSAEAGADGALFLPGQNALIVSDVHFEKGSAYARRGQMLPPYDTRENLRRLSESITARQPDLVIALGDSFHDATADNRMDPDDVATLQALVRSVGDWVWIEGNHDPAPSPRFGGQVMHTLALAGLQLRHEPTEGPCPGEVAGHLHPCARLKGRGRSLRARCFATDGSRLIMPAFGAFTGGLNICDRAFARCFDGVPDALVMGRDRVYPVAGRKCVADRRGASAG
jgi:DNA ligase-associated metallophosphoesterase